MSREYVCYDTGQSMTRKEWQQYFQTSDDVAAARQEYNNDFDAWWWDMTQRYELIIEECCEAMKINL